MIRLLFSLLPCLVAASAMAAQPPLMTAAELAARLGDSNRVIIDIRDDKTPYDAGHIPGAQHAPYSKWRGPNESPGRLPSDDKLTVLVRALGIDAATPVVVVYEGIDATDFGAAARVYWTLKAAGVRELSIVNGGMTAWRAARLPLSTEVMTRAPSKFDLAWNPRLVATRAEVEQVIDNPSVRLLDARPAEFFKGRARHPAAKAPGTIVGAKHVSHDVWFATSAAMLPADDVRRIAQQYGVWSPTTSDQPTISFCNSGHWAATNWFVLSELLGNNNVKLYPESLVEWSNSGGAMDHVPGRLQQFWLQLKAASSAP